MSVVCQTVTAPLNLHLKLVYRETIEIISTLDIFFQRQDKTDALLKRNGIHCIKRLYYMTQIKEKLYESNTNV